MSKKNLIAELSLDIINKIKTPSDWKRKPLERGTDIEVLIEEWLDPVESTIVHVTPDNFSMDLLTLMGFMVAGTQKTEVFNGLETVMSGKTVKDLILEKSDEAGRVVYPVSFRLHGGKFYKAATQGYITSLKNQGDHPLIKAAMAYNGIVFEGKEQFPLFVLKGRNRRTNVDAKNMENWIPVEQILVDVRFNE